MSLGDATVRCERCQRKTAVKHTVEIDGKVVCVACAQEVQRQRKQQQREKREP